MLRGGKQVAAAVEQQQGGRPECWAAATTATAGGVTRKVHALSLGARLGQARQQWLQRVAHQARGLAHREHGAGGVQA